jgi:hypothetical protein
MVPGQDSETSSSEQRAAESIRARMAPQLHIPGTAHEVRAESRTMANYGSKEERLKRRETSSL